jgi:hypothetical protein
VFGRFFVCFCRDLFPPWRRNWCVAGKLVTSFEPNLVLFLAFLRRCLWSFRRPARTHPIEGGFHEESLLAECEQQTWGCGTAEVVHAFGSAWKAKKMKSSFFLRAGSPAGGKEGLPFSQLI